MWALAFLVPLAAYYQALDAIIYQIASAKAAFEMFWEDVKFAFSKQ